MKLTDEMKAAICNAYMQSKSVSEREEAIILAGYRMGQRDAAPAAVAPEAPQLNNGPVAATQGGSEPETRTLGSAHPTAAPAEAPPAEDGLTHALKSIATSYAVRADIRNTVAEAAARIVSDAQEIARLDDLRAEWKDKANRNAETSYALMDELDASREREAKLRGLLRCAHSHVDDKSLWCVIREALAAPDSAAEQEERTCWHSRDQ